jgi:cytochrome c oxidase cbb3-type subunit 3
MSDLEREIAELPHAGISPRDGVGEEDHPVPLWFNAAWIATWILGVAYIVWYLGLSSWSQERQYAAEVAVAESRAAELRAQLPQKNPYQAQAPAIAEGQETFVTICAACHGMDAHGLVGPSLVDGYWKYGSSDSEHFKSVAEGRPGGMPPWGPQLGEDKIWKVLAYVESLPKSAEPGFGAPDYVPPPPPAAP